MSLTVSQLVTFLKNLYLMNNRFGAGAVSRYTVPAPILILMFAEKSIGLHCRSSIRLLDKGITKFILPFSTIIKNLPKLDKKYTINISTSLKR
jgi:hypothetical protein